MNLLSEEGWEANQGWMVSQKAKDEAVFCSPDPSGRESRQGMGGQEIAEDL